MVKYRNLPPDIYYSVRRSLTEDFVLSHYPSYHDSMRDSFEIVSIDGRISVYYYKDGTLEVDGTEENRAYRRIIRRINTMVSKKDYI